MYKEVYEIDENGFKIKTHVAQFNNEGIPIVKLDENIIVADNPHNLIRPKWTGTEWIEGATQKEIEESIKPQPAQPTLEQRIADLENTILTLLEVL